ncbi:SDR family NAD(P)-dependent oxidoreductase [Ectobacillus sp. JY-23]|uniref:SDR family NAD(P)-dependent oxidoreductase n=1 Tax=Ectobacillus sp. JY-23 TaxID=2933872 RepID=UPI001FF21766|nr:SDR family NAD(P)-dependent oxidoreductase [Ectobacillus sp. JY-23]UOY92430.1 SDR family NAD(P)-dependent oxidoreductase [Ectobacillus sp. JY-23]
MKHIYEDLTDKTALVTGGTGGIGKTTAQALAGLGATVLITGRDKKRGEHAVEEIKYLTGNKHVQLLLADLTSQTDIKQLAHHIKEHHDLHILVNNAGGIYTERIHTKDGIEATWALNYMAPFLVTKLLLPLLEKSGTSRIVNVNAASPPWSKLNIQDIEDTEVYRPLHVYGQSKLANLLFTYELARQLDGTSVTVNAVNPGGADTALSRTMIHSTIFPWYLKMAATIMNQFSSNEKAAVSSVVAAAAVQFAGKSGLYLNPTGKPVKSARASYNQQLARQVWEWGESRALI